MKVLVLASDYPKPGRLFAGIFNERGVTALRDVGDEIAVLAPRPYAPPFLSSLVPRWKAEAATPSYEVRNGVPVHRPAYLQIPRVGGAFCLDQGAFFWCYRVARALHRRIRFDVILSFDLVAAGGLAWRIGRDLGIPATGWATGDDVRFPASSSYGRAVIRALECLDFVFYQSHELLDKAAGLLGLSPDTLLSDRHLILPRGIPSPPCLAKEAIRKNLRMAWGIRDDQILVLNIGRLHRDKGIFELVQAVSLATARDPRITCVLVGSSPAHDETAALHQKLAELPGLRHTIRLLPACSPDMVWEYLCAADIFAFTSHREGMPNSLLEALAMGVPAVAFAIPPVVEIDAGTGSLFLVPPFDTALFAEALVQLAASPDDQVRLGARGRERVMARFMVRENMAVAHTCLAEVVHKWCSSPKRCL